jgi:hypothetical protein
MTRSHAGPLAAALLLTAVLAGCTPSPSPTPTHEGTTMNATQAHDEIDAVLATAQQAVGGSWQALDTGAEICSTASGKKGAVFPFMRIGPGVPADQRAAIIASVTKKWTAAGFAPTLLAGDTYDGVADSELRYPASGYGTDGVYLSLQLSIKASGAEGQSRCIPGDADKINEERQK